jgi:2Fe-2S ferredoxin
LPKVIYVHPDGTREELDIEVGTSVRSAAIAHGIDGIVGECGGSAMCATCHVYLDEADLARAPEMQPDENEMLEFTVAPRRETSRLSCQLIVTSELNGLVVYVPEAQR